MVALELVLGFGIGTFHGTVKAESAAIFVTLVLGHNVHGGKDQKGGNGQGECCDRESVGCFPVFHLSGPFMKFLGLSLCVLV